MNQLSTGAEAQSRSKYCALTACHAAHIIHGFRFPCIYTSRYSFSILKLSLTLLIRLTSALYSYLSLTLLQCGIVSQFSLVTMGARSFSVVALRMWNALPQNIH